LRSNASASSSTTMASSPSIARAGTSCCVQPSYR
jgi:hypothetical protein